MRNSHAVMPPPNGIQPSLIVMPLKNGIQKNKELDTDFRRYDEATALMQQILKGAA